MWKVSLEFLNKERVGGFEERITRQLILKVVEDSLNVGVEFDDGLWKVAIHERFLWIGLEKKFLPCCRDEGRVDGGGRFDSSELERFTCEVVDGPEVSARQLEDGVDGLRVEGEVVGAGDADAMLHVVECFGAREKSQ